MAITILSACSTIFSSGEQELAFDANVPDVDIYINNKKVCSTPCITKVERANKKLLIVARKEDYTDRSLFIDPGYNPMFMGNFLSLWTSTFGFTTDATDDHLWNYAPNSFYIAMHHEPQTEAEKKLHQQADKIRLFVLRNHPMLQTEHYDNKDSDGEYMKTLSQMSGISAAEISDIISRSASESECAERVVAAFMQAHK